MAQDTKNRICETALCLFNERGYAQVSLRDIAKEAGVAIGSLTYHFAKKDDLLTKMLADLHEGFEGMLDHEARGTMRLARMLDLFAAARANQDRYPFYFHNIDAIARDSDAMRDESIAFERTLVSYYDESLHVLADDGIVNIGTAATETLACAMVALHACWALPISPASNGASSPSGIDGVLAAALAAIVDPSHVNEFQKLCADKGIQL